MLVDMFISGANNLINNKQKVDDMNVFPVPDGDTGTNMSMTMKACVSNLKSKYDTDVSQIAASIANDTLRGARGNSGVILSQLMRGFKKAFTDADVCDVKVFANALKYASESAYRAVMKPTEGTILTVARIMGEKAQEFANNTEDFVEFFALVVDAGNEALKSTPELLPKLKQAGVVDSGGQGLMYLYEGMYYFVQKGTIIELSQSETDVDMSQSHADITEEIKFAYCTECIIDKKVKGKTAIELKSKIEKIGDSMVFVDDDDIVKLHIHTNNPDVVLCEALKIGSLASVKIENMVLQHNDIIDSKVNNTPKVPYAFISVASGDGMVNLLKDIGVTYVIEGGQTMNPSTEDFINAINSQNADNIFVFPNNKNIIMAANQASEISDKNVIVIETKHVTQNITAMISFDPDLDSKTNEETFNEAIKLVKSAQVTNAVRDTIVDDINIKEGEYLSIVEGKIKASKENVNMAVEACLENMIDEDSSVVSLYFGSDVTQDDADVLCAELQNIYGDIDVMLSPGNQSVYHYLISVE